MAERSHAQAIADHLVHAYGGNLDTYRENWAEDSKQLDLEQLWADRVALSGLIQAARAYQAAVDHELAQRIGEGGSLRMDDSLIRYKPSGAWKVLDPDSFFDYLAEDIRECFRADDFRVSSVRACIQRRLENEMAGADPEDIKKRTKVVLDSLIDYDEGDPRVEVMPATSPKAPKYAAKMQHGEHRPGRKKPAPAQQGALT